MAETRVGPPVPPEAPEGSLRARLRANPALRPLYRAGMFLSGLTCVLSGFALSVLPGPLTIPPVLLGLWIWSKEFLWAERLFRSFRARAERAWAHARRNPVSTTLFTVAGLAGAAYVFWAVGHYGLVEWAQEFLLG